MLSAHIGSTAGSFLYYEKCYKMTTLCPGLNWLLDCSVLWAFVVQEYIQTKKFIGQSKNLSQTKIFVHHSMNGLFVFNGTVCRAVLWIRIRIVSVFRSFSDPDPYSEYWSISGIRIQIHTCKYSVKWRQKM